MGSRLFQRFKEHWRRNSVLLFLLLTAAILVIQAFFLQFHNTQFLQTEGSKRYIRNIKLPSVRGTIYDRNGETIASSAEVRSVWADPSILSQHPEEFPFLAQILDIPLDELTRRIERYRKHRFIWLKRQLPPNEGEAIEQLRIPGVEVQREYRRYYPHTEITSHLLGFTNIDDEGIEGIEKSYQEWLMGDSALQRVIKDSKNRIIRILEEHPPEKEGQDLYLTIDHRIQIIAYDALKKAVERHNAVGGSIIVADSRTGDILAMVNQPAGNPNRIADRRAILLKNKALTDLFEPGSTIKPFIVALGLESGKWTPDTVVTTGRNFRVNGHPILDVARSEQLSITDVIVKSSNIGVAKIALSLDPQIMWELFTDLEIGERSHLNLVGEPMGTKGDLRKWQLNDFEYVTKSYGYGISINAVKLAQIYTVFANEGVLRPLRLAMHEPMRPTKRIFSPKVANDVLDMMELALDKKRGGGGWRAAVPQYRVAGKSGTVRKSGAGGYTNQRHQSFFVAVAPVSEPRYIVSVVIDEPREGGYYGGLVAGPVVSEVMGNTLRILGVRPDALEKMPQLQLLSGD